MKKINTFYWIANGLFAFMMLGSAIPDVLSMEVAVEGMHNGLGYPLYFIPFIGVAKVLGVVAILVPGYSRIKEWAYAGLLFDLVGATYSIFSVGKGGADLYGMLVPIALGVLSYVLYQKRNQPKTVQQYATVG